MKLYLALILFYLFSCQKKQDTSDGSNSAYFSKTDLIGASSKDTLLLEEFFVDSLTIGRKMFNKVEVFRYKSTDSIYVCIKFYSKQSYSWKLNQTIFFLKDGILDCDTKLCDFNNDKFNDLTVVSAIAARGANEVRRLFIYDNLTDKLIEMKNAENYPNMLYNKDLNCIDAFLVYGGSSTVFLQISGDSLKEFARVEVIDGITVREFDKHGKEKVIFKDSTNKSDYVRFKTYKPLKEYDNY